MAEESQPAKIHKPTISPNDTQSEESEHIGAQISTQLAIPIGEEVKVDTASSNEVFMESDARKTIDNLIFITRDLPKFRSRQWPDSTCHHGNSGKIQVPLERAHAYSHIRKALTEALPLLETSAMNWLRP